MVVLGQEVSDPLSILTRGFVFDRRFRIINKIGEGNYAKVFKVKDQITDRTYALKVFKPEFIDDPKFPEIFKKTFESAKNIKHDNVVELYWASQDVNGLYYYVMEYVDGGSLSDRISQGSLLNQ